jgi:hypothetical protein
MINPEVSDTIIGRCWSKVDEIYHDWTLTSDETCGNYD